MANILVIDDDKNILRLLEFSIKRAGHNIITGGDGLEGLSLAQAKKPDLIVVDVMMPNMTGYDFCKEARKQEALKETPIIIFSARFQPVDKKTALEAGATDYMAKTASPDKLIKRINELLPSSSSAAAKQGIVGMFSLRGGSGVTSLAVNLATSIIQVRQARTLLVDLAQLGGHAALMLGLRPTSNVARIFSDTPGDLTPDAVKPHLIQHNSGIYLLASSHMYGHELSLSNSRLEQLMKVLKSGFPFLVADIPHCMDAQFASTLQLFDKIAVVISPDMPSLQSTAIALQSLSRLGMPEEKISLVVNQVSSQAALPVETIQKAIKRPIIAHIPFDPDMPKSVNSGKPLVLNNPQAPASIAITELANTLLS